MPQSGLPLDPLAAHEVVMQRAQQAYDRRADQRRKPLPDEARAEVRLFRGSVIERLDAEVLDLSSTGMRLAAFVNQRVAVGDRCEIFVGSHHDCRSHHATVRWVEPHPLIQVFGVEFEHEPITPWQSPSDRSG
jgi:hypothetical protein